MKDTDKMPFGKYIGQKLCNIPGSYLIWLLENGKNVPHGLQTYIRDNMKILKAEKEKSDIQFRNQYPK